MNDELRELYQEVILDHYKRPRNKRLIENPTGQGEGHNPICGDEVNVMLRVLDGRIEDVSFEGEGCAISMASASMMTEAVKGKGVDEAMAIMEQFRAALTHGSDGVPEELGPLVALEGVKDHPVRIKCATLAWHSLKAALEGGGETSTE